MQISADFTPFKPIYITKVDHESWRIVLAKGMKLFEGLSERWADHLTQLLSQHF